MKKARMLVLTLSALVLLSGCAKSAEPMETENPPSTKIEEQTKNEVPPSSSEGNMADKQLFGTDGQSAESEKTEKITPQSESDEKEPPEGAESAPDEPPAQGNMQPSAKENVQPPAAPAQTPDCPPLTFTIELTTQPTESDSPQQAEPTPPPTVTPTPEPTPEPDPVPTPDPVPEPTPVPAFDVPACVQNAVNYGTGIGLVYDSTATACWDDPLTANAQSLYTERDLRDRLDWYMASGFTSFCVWSETVADGSYLVYIGYA